MVISNERSLSDKVFVVAIGCVIGVLVSSCMTDDQGTSAPSSLGTGGTDTLVPDAVDAPILEGVSGISMSKPNSIPVGVSGVGQTRGGTGNAIGAIPQPNVTCTQLTVETVLRPSFRVNDADILLNGRDLYVVVSGVEGTARYRYDPLQRALVDGVLVERARADGGSRFSRVAVAGRFLAYGRYQGSHGLYLGLPNGVASPWIAATTWSAVGPVSPTLNLGTSFDAFPEIAASGTLVALTGRSTSASSPVQIVEVSGSTPTNLGFMRWSTAQVTTRLVAMTDDWFFISNLGGVDMISIPDLRSALLSNTVPVSTGATTSFNGEALDMDAFGAKTLALLENTPSRKILRVVDPNPSVVEPPIAEIDVSELGEVSRVAVESNVVVLVAHESQFNGVTGGPGIVYVATGCWK